MHKYILHYPINTTRNRPWYYEQWAVSEALPQGHLCNSHIIEGTCAGNSNRVSQMELLPPLMLT